MILHNQRSGIPYTKEQARRWLTFLASNMQQRGQTIFLIEQLQPTWLVTRWQRWLYIFMSRLLWMVFSGGLVMGVGSLLIQPKNLFVWLFIQMFILLITGLNVGLLDILRTRLRYKRFLEWTLKPLRTFVVDLLVIGVSSSLFSFLFSIFSEDLFLWLFNDLSRIDLGAAWQLGTVVYILFGWCVWNRRSTQRHPDNEICTIETITWSWHNFRQNGRQGLFFGLLIVFSGMLLFGLFVLPIAGLIGALNGQLGEELVRLSYSSVIGIGILGGLVFGILYGLLGGIVLYGSGSQPLPGDEIQICKTIKWSLKNARRNGYQGLIFGLIFGVLNGFFIELLDGNVTLAKQQGELIIGIFDGLLLGLLWVRIYGWGRWFIGLLVGFISEFVSLLIWGRSIGLLYGLFSGLFMGLSFGVLFGLFYGLLIGSFLGLFYGIWGGIRMGVRETSTRPNEGVWLTIVYSLITGTIVGLLIGLITGSNQDIVSGLLLGTCSGLLVGLWCGGFDVLQHSITRFLLWQRGDAPLNYARFLNYVVAELNFLQRVGGGYIFAHRYLLEHFAEKDPGTPTA